MCAVFMLLCVLWQFKRHVYRKSLWLGWQAGKFYRYYDQQWHAVEPINVLVLPWLIRFSLANEFERRDVLILTFAISPEAHRQSRILLRFNTDPSNK